MTTQQPEALDQSLENAIILSWSDLSPSQECSSMQVDYDFSPDGLIDSLKLWLSTSRGHWHLVCQYGIQTHNSVQFEKAYQSAGLGRNLEFIMHHQNEFLPVQNYGRAGLLQIQKPTPEQTEIARVGTQAHLKAEPVPA